PLRPGELVPSFLQNALRLTGEQKKRIEELQKDSEAKLDEILNDEQKQKLKELRENPSRRGSGAFGPIPQFGQILPSPLAGKLKLSDEQKKKQEELQKSVNVSLDKIFNEDQKKHFNDMREAFRGGGFGMNQKPPDANYKLEVFCLDRASGKVL